MKNVEMLCQLDKILTCTKDQPEIGSNLFILKIFQPEFSTEAGTRCRLTQLSLILCIHFATFNNCPAKSHGMSSDT